jgi:tRNA A-37 threonylcarbamoyl transferase component Bud32
VSPRRTPPRVDISKLRTRTYLPLKRLGEYELLRKIGSGGMAEVWMGRRAAMAGASKAVAIKLLARDVLDDPTYRQMFLDEARLSMLLTNSNVVQVFDVGEVHGECFMVMEWVDGLNLSELSHKMLREGERMPVVLAAHVVGEVLRALAYAHGLHHEGSKATIVHRDVSPQNVLVSVSGEVKLADFGVARLAREETSGLHVKGKLRYMAPEQLRGRSREPTVDLYAVGAILHELLAGERFRQTRDEADLYAMVLSGEHPPLGVEVPAELDELRKRLLEPDPAKRIQTADEALELLHGWPGYRNSSLALGKLARRWVGVGAPRSGIVSSEALLGGGAQARPGSGPSGASAAATTPAQSGSGASAAATTPAQARTALDSAQPRATLDSGPSGPSAAATVVESVHPESGPQQDRGTTETRTWVGSGEQETAPTALIPAQGPRSSASSMLIVAALTLALSFGVFGLGFPLGWWGGGGEAARAEAPAAASDVSVTPQPEEEPEENAASAGSADSQVAIEPAVAETGELDEDEATEEGETGAAGTAEAGEIGAADTSEAGETGAADTSRDDTRAETGGDHDKTQTPPPRRKQPVDRTPAKVEFSTGEFNFVWVKVGGKQLPLQPVASVELKPGRHRVYLRESEDDDWVSAKSIKLEPGARYKIRMLKPAGLKIEKL